MKTMPFIDRLKAIFMGGKANPESRQKAMAAFRRRYISFKQLLQANADLAVILANLTQAQHGEKTLQTREVRKQCRRANLLCQRMAASLNAMASDRYQELAATCENLGTRIEGELRKHTRGDLHGMVMPLTEVDASMAYMAGAKSANLGEAANVLNFRIPRGFAITIKAGTVFLLRNGDLIQKIYNHLEKIDADRPHTIRAASKAIANLVEKTPLPENLAAEALKMWDEIFGAEKDTVLAAVRSSAVAEDGVQSFAGQYESVLGVGRERLCDAIKKVIGSLFSERALTYRASHGYALDATGMGLCCLEMVNAKAGGVAFSRHPVDLRSSCVVINGVWGLGESVVDGSAVCDQWHVSRAYGKIRQCVPAHKTTAVQLTGHKGEFGTTNVDVAGELVDVPCLSDDQAREIAQMACALEQHYQYPQDIEWAVDQDDQVILLQTRPLGLDCSSPDYGGDDCPISFPGHTHPVLSGGDIASRGVACGKVVHIHANEEMNHFPDGSILVAENSSPNIMTVLRKAGALITQTGSLTGHMASICREFGIPAIFNLPGAASILREDETITVDALSGRIYKGEIQPLLELRLPRRQKIADSPALSLLRRVSQYILPLSLIDPQSENFAPQNCASLHDIMRYAHEKSYSEMFTLSDSLSESGIAGVAARVNCRIPLDLYVIDMGGGLKTKNKSVVMREDIASLPFVTVLDGMLNPALQSGKPRPVNLRGFMSVMGQSMIGGNLNAGERFGDRSYAVISDRYLNFSSRVGYHYAIVDAWCGDTINKNYIRFEFAGGAAGDEHRARRARCIGLILGELGFTVEVVRDRVRARFQKYPRFETTARLDQLGRLLIMTRQMDMLMINEDAVHVFADNFLNGIYH